MPVYVSNYLQYLAQWLHCLRLPQSVQLLVPYSGYLEWLMHAYSGYDLEWLMHAVLGLA